MENITIEDVMTYYECDFYTASEILSLHNQLCTNRTLELAYRLNNIAGLLKDIALRLDQIEDELEVIS